VKYLEKAEEEITGFEKIYILYEILEEASLLFEKDQYLPSFKMVREALALDSRNQSAADLENKLREEWRLQVVSDVHIFLDEGKWAAALEKIRDYAEAAGGDDETSRLAKEIEIIRRNNGRVAGIVKDVEYEESGNEQFVLIRSSEELSPEEVLLIFGKGRIRILEEAGKNEYDAEVIEGTGIREGDRVIKIQ